MLLKISIHFKRVKGFSQTNATRIFRIEWSEPISQVPAKYIVDATQVLWSKSEYLTKPTVCSLRVVRGQVP